jgi:hypothetical protein
MTVTNSFVPPQELRDKWLNEAPNASVYDYLIEVAQWGADTELESCCEYLVRCAQWEPEDVDELRAALAQPEPQGQTLDDVKHFKLMDLQDLLNLTKDLPPAGSLELYQLLNEKECADERRRWDQAFADAIYKTTHRREGD